MLSLLLQQLDNEFDLLEKSWEDVKTAGQDWLQQRAVKEDDYSEVLNLQSELKSRIRQCESVLNMTTRFHLASRQVRRHFNFSSSPGGYSTT